MSKFSGSSFWNVNIFSFICSSMTVNGTHLSLGQNKTFEGVIFGFGKCWSTFFMTNKRKKIISKCYLWRHSFVWLPSPGALWRSRETWPCRSPRASSRCSPTTPPRPCSPSNWRTPAGWSRSCPTNSYYTGETSPRKQLEHFASQVELRFAELTSR